MATNVTPSMVHSAADEHRNVDKDIESSMTRLDGVIDQLDSRNDGALMDALRKVQEGWNEEMVDVKKKLQAMAEFIDDAANQLEAENQAHAGEIK